MLFAYYGTSLLFSLNHHLMVFIKRYKFLKKGRNFQWFLNLLWWAWHMECIIDQLFSDWLMSPFSISSISHFLVAAEPYFTIQLPVLQYILAYILSVSTLSAHVVFIVDLSLICLCIWEPVNMDKSMTGYVSVWTVLWRWVLISAWDLTHDIGFH